MRITFLVNYDLASLLALNYLVPALQQHDLTVFYTRKSVNTTVTSLAELAKFDAKRLSTPEPLVGFEAFNAQRLNDVNTADYPRFIAAQPELTISIRHMSILKSAVINTPTMGTINLHSGHLPAYQGVMATFWALLNKEQKIGTTLHFIEDSTIDTGSIISQSVTTANYQRSYLWNVLNIYRGGCENILKSVKTLEIKKPLISKPQSGQANYHSFPNTADIAKCGRPLFNNSDSAELFI